MTTVCWFCEQNQASVVVKRQERKRKIPLNYCLLHYYTTSAVRCENVEIINQKEFDEQLPAVQELFSEAFVQLQRDLSEEAARQFASQQHDPLAILHDLHKKPVHKKPTPVKKQKIDPNAGGFHREVAVPERIIRTQQEQMKKHMEMEARMNRTPTATSRRKVSRKSIWNTVLDEKPAAKKSAPHFDFATEDVTTTCTCGSKQVDRVGTNANRNQDMRKGETWGNKDRGDEIMSRYQCLECGKVWNEEE